MARYDEYVTLRLPEDSGGVRVELLARLCTECGSVVLDVFVHDRWHDWVGR